MRAKIGLVPRLILCVLVGPQDLYRNIGLWDFPRNFDNIDKKGYAQLYMIMNFINHLGRL